MVANRSCKLRKQRVGCLDHCLNWVKYNEKPIKNQINDDLRELQRYEKFLDINVNIMIVLSILVILSFIVYLAFNLRS